MDQISIQIDDFGNGYRPTAAGIVNGRRFSFRIVDGGWTFVVGKPDARNVWWHSEENELDFETGGKCEVMLWHTEALPTFMLGLRRYLEHLGLQNGELAQVMRSAEAQALELFEKNPSPGHATDGAPRRR